MLPPQIFSSTPKHFTLTGSAKTQKSTVLPVHTVTVFCLMCICRTVPKYDQPPTGGTRLQARASVCSFCLFRWLVLSNFLTSWSKPNWKRRCPHHMPFTRIHSYYSVNAATNSCILNLFISPCEPKPFIMLYTIPTLYELFFSDKTSIFKGIFSTRQWDLHNNSGCSCRWNPGQEKVICGEMTETFPSSVCESVFDIRNSVIRHRTQGRGL